MTGLADHVLLVIIAVALPLWGYWQYRRMLAGLASNRRDARVRGYREVMVVEWTLAILVIALWTTAGTLTPFFGAGAVGELRWWVGGALAAVACVFMTAQTVVILRSPERMLKMQAEFASLRPMIPSTPREGRAFSMLSITAGICEEILYRGFLITYFAVFFPLWVAVLGSTVIFALGHSYQGVAGATKAGVVGLVMAGFFLLTGSLWPAMVTHAVIDLNSGYLGRKVFGIPPTLSSSPV